MSKKLLSQEAKQEMKYSVSENTDFSQLSRNKRITSALNPFYFR